MKTDLMIVDDMKEQLDLMKQVIQMANPALTIATASSGREALSRLRSSDIRPKVILLDIRMPGMSGTQVLSEIKSDPLLKKIPVCMFSSADLNTEICDCYESGASFFFKKPTGLDELLAFIGHFQNIWFKYASLCMT